MMIITLLTACGPGERKSAKGDKANSIDVSLFPTAVTNNAKAVEGATLKVAIVKDSPLKGIFNQALYDGHRPQRREGYHHVSFRT